MTDNSVRATADAISRYLAAYPASADTADGVQQWWLRPSGVEATRDVIEAALRLLEMEQRVERLRLAGREVWRARRGD